MTRTFWKKSLTKSEWQIKEDRIEGYELVAEAFRSSGEFTSVSEAIRSDRISITTKELLEKEGNWSLTLPQ